MTFQTMKKNRTRLVLVRQHFGSILYDRVRSYYLPFDHQITDLLVQSKSSSGERLAEDISRTRGQDNLSRLVRQFEEQGFFNSRGQFAGEILPVPPWEGHLTGPLTLHLEIVSSCNLNCKHCFASNQRSSQPPLSLSELSNLFENLASIGCFRLGLTGGEPLLRTDLIEIIDLAIEAGLSPCLATNGLLITEEFAREVGRRSLVWLNISLEGASASTHDVVRGQGNFDRAIERIRVMSKHAPFSLAFTVMRSNLHEINDCVSLARDLGARAAVFRPLYPVGSARSYPELLPTFREYLDALGTLFRDSDEHNCQFCSEHPWGPGNKSDEAGIVYSNFGCGAGNTVCSVSVSGDVSPCSFLGPEFVAGNIKNSSISEIWHRSTVFTNIRRLNGNKDCECCSRFESCSGGCRARAFLEKGSIDAPDSWCAEQEHRVKNGGVNDDREFSRSSFRPRC